MDYFTGQIILWAGARVPVNWLPCDGRLMQINGNEALYSIIGTIYGGDGQTTFALPNLQSRVPVGQGQGTGLTNRVIGASGGEEEVTLTAATIPPHTHTMIASSLPASSSSPSNAIPASVPNTSRFYFPAVAGTTPTAMAVDSVSDAGGNGPHLNVMPSIGIQYIICVTGIYPVKP